MSTKEFESNIEELKHALGALVRRIRASVPSEQQDLSWTQKAVLIRLEKEGAMTSADLARAENVKPQSMGTAISYLEEIGFVEKKSDANDGRQILVKLTPKGIAIRKSGSDASKAWLGQAVSKLDKKEQAILFEATHIIRRLTEPS